MTRTIMLLCAALLSFQVRPTPDAGPAKQMAQVLGSGSIRITSEDPGYLAASLFGQTPLGIELEPGPVAVPSDRLIAVKQGEKFGDLIWKVTFKFPAYHPAARFGVITITPPDQAAASLLGKRLESYAVTEATLANAVTTLWRALDPSYSLQPTIERPNGTVSFGIDNILTRKVTVSLGATTALEVLNSLIVQVPHFTWVVSYAQRPPRIQDASIKIVALMGGAATFGRSRK